MTDDLKILGQTVRGAITADQIETVDCPASVDWVTATSDEVTAFCPVTEQPDLYTVEIGYSPLSVDGATAQIIESKALKLYLHGFRNRGIMCEPLAAQIAHDLSGVLGTDAVEVKVTQQKRGGIVLSAQARGRIPQ